MAASFPTTRQQPSPTEVAKFQVMLRGFKTENKESEIRTEWAPTKIQKYDSTPHPVRLFFPTGYDSSSTKLFSALFTIHGGGWTVGTSSGDDQWNRRFADSSDMLVVSLDYSLAPEGPFPRGIKDLVASYLSVVEDSSLPIDYSRIAIGGFSAGGNLALAVSQDPKVRIHKAAPKACIPMYAAFDLWTPYSAKINRRPFKIGKLTGCRGAEADIFDSDTINMFLYAYIPVGTNLKDPHLSPGFAKRENLPPHIFVISAELDYLGYESLEFVHRITGREPLQTDIVGSPDPKEPRKLDLEDPRYNLSDPKAGVRWLLVPDTIHGFDFHFGNAFMDADGNDDATAKALQCMSLIKEWLEENL